MGSTSYPLGWSSQRAAGLSQIAHLDEKSLPRILGNAMRALDAAGKVSWLHRRAGATSRRKMVQRISIGAFAHDGAETDQIEFSDLAGLESYLCPIQGCD